MPTSAPPFQSLHHLSPHVTPLSPCSCLHCMGTDDFGVQTPSLQSAKYLLHRTPDCNYRYLQAMGAFRSLFPVFTNPSLPSRRKLQVYAQIVLAILFYGSESQVFTLAQITGFNSLHYMVLRQIFQVKSSHYHRVLHPSQEDCSNEYLLSLTYRHAPRLLIPSQPISVQRLRFLGHILRHFEALEHRIISHTSHIGLKLLSEAFRRSEQLRRNQHPTTEKTSHPMYATGTQSMVHIYFGPSLADWYDTTAICNALSRIAMDRDEWDQIVFPGNLIVHSSAADV